MLNILLVEDNPVLRKKMSDFFLRNLSQCRIWETSNGKSCREALLQHPMDMVIMDIRLAGENGLDLVRSIKRRFPEIHVTVHSMLDALEYREMAKQVGADAFFSKKSNSIQDLLSEARSIQGNPNT